MAYFGPAISAQNFEVGDEVRQAFVSSRPEWREAFKPRNEKWLADIFMLARLQLLMAGVTRIFGGDLCTFSDRDRFFSYRRDGLTGRMASLIWLAPETNTNVARL
jgi:copper oxidase (laccase) domain-containing protein